MGIRSEHRFSWWHQGVLLFDDDYAWSTDRVECVEASSAAWLGQSRSGGTTYVSPGGAMFGSDDAPLTIEVAEAAPAGEPEAESVGEFDLRLSSGRLVLEVSGDEGQRTIIELPVGDWRARWSGFGEAAAEAVAHEQRPRQFAPGPLPVAAVAAGIASRRRDHAWPVGREPADRPRVLPSRDRRGSCRLRRGVLHQRIPHCQEKVAVAPRE
jgi:hypothetical protein